MIRREPSTLDIFKLDSCVFRPRRGPSTGLCPTQLCEPPGVLLPGQFAPKLPGIFLSLRPTKPSDSTQEEATRLNGCRKHVRWWCYKVTTHSRRETPALGFGVQARGSLGGPLDFLWLGPLFRAPAPLRPPRLDNRQTLWSLPPTRSHGKVSETRETIY